MFGPDKCGATNKVHFISKHKNPKNGEFVEHHLKFLPSVPSDKLSHVYTAILKPDNEVRILVDGEEKKKANVLSSEDFEPLLILSKTIPDLEDKKPEDWDERADLTIGVLISIVVVFLSVFYKLTLGGAKVNVEKKKPETATETSTSEERPRRRKKRRPHHERGKLGVRVRK